MMQGRPWHAGGELILCQLSVFQSSSMVAMGKKMQGTNPLEDAN